MHIGERPKLEGETENMGVCTNVTTKRKGVTCDVVQVPTTGDRVERRGWKIGSGGAKGRSRPNGTQLARQRQEWVAK